MDNSYIVTGAAGFIGSNLCDFLIDKGDKVIAVDNLSTGYLSNLSRVIDSIEFTEEKIENFDFNKISNIDAVVHLAAQPSVPLSITEFGESSSSNMLGTIRVIDYCRLNNIPLVYASSSAVYGNLELGDDQRTEVDLLSPYATDKYAMELYAEAANKLYQLSSIGLRFFNVYGPRQDPTSPYSGVISVFADRLLNDQSITINGGYQTRDFIYVKDVVECIYRAIKLTTGKTICEVSNILTGTSVTIDALADQMMDVVGVQVEKNYKELPAGDPEQSDGTSNKMQQLLSVDLNRFTTLGQGLIDTVRYIKSQN